MSGEARPFDQLAAFQPEKGAVLANATPIGMHPNKDRIPVSEVCLSYISFPMEIINAVVRVLLLIMFLCLPF